MEEGIVLTMRGICKSFPGVKALSDVDFTLRKGEMPSFLLHLISCSVDGLRRKHKRSYCSKWQNRKSLRFWQGESCRRRRRGAPSLPRTPTPAATQANTAGLPLKGPAAAWAPRRDKDRPPHLKSQMDTLNVHLTFQFT